MMAADALIVAKCSLQCLWLHFAPGSRRVVPHDIEAEDEVEDGQQRPQPWTGAI